jgi:glycine cleavage system T protein (aminomethyltransferase)
MGYGAGRDHLVFVQNLSLAGEVMQQTPLTEWHRAAGAKLVDFAGWEMPLSYSGVIDEHETVRRSAGLFDISHMGRIAVEGPAAEAFLQRLVTRDLAAMADGSARYALVCNESGGVLDDVVVYRRTGQQFLVVVNASNRTKMLTWFERQAAGDAQIWDLSGAIAMIAVQGPAALGLLEPMTSVAEGARLTAMKRWTVRQAVVAGAELLLATTGYTGEPGVELFVEAGRAASVWEAVLTAGKAQGVKPIGLGARDTLRLEMGYSLYGHELDETITPLEAGLGWAVDLDGKEFIGRQALRAQQQAGLSRQMSAFALPDRAVPRQGYRLLQDDREVGMVTSGNVSPMLQRGIGLGFLPSNLSHLGQTVDVEIRNKPHPATIVPLPFYKGTEGGHA